MGKEDKDFLDAVAVAVMVGVGFIVFLELTHRPARSGMASSEESELDFLDKIRREIKQKVRRAR